MNWILFICIIGVLLYLYYNYSKKNKRDKHFSNLLNNWLNTKPNKEFNFSKITRYKQNLTASNNVYQNISNQTNLDLDLDDVFEYIDRTTSSIGQQYLYYKLHTIESKETDKLINQLETIFDKDEILRTNTLLDLKQLNTNEAYYYESLFNTSHNYTKSNTVLIATIINTLIVAILASSFFYPIVSLGLIPFCVYNAILHYKTKNAILDYQSGVQVLSKVYKANINLINHTESYNVFTDKESIVKLKELLNTAQYLSFGKKLDSEVATLIWMFVEWIKIMFNIEYLAFNRLQRKLNLYKDNLHQAFINIGKIDLALTKLHIKNTEQVVSPTFTIDKKIKAVEIVHPLIQNCVTNDLSLKNQSMLITGSNMSGKTTFIRTIAVNALLGQTIGLVFAKEFEYPFFKIHSFIRINDDMSNNRSYYLQEVLTLKKLIDESKIADTNLFLLDEIMKGTNTIERIAGSTSILKYLNNEKDMVFVSTHDLELIDLLENNQYAIAHFNETIQNNNLKFDYKLKEGIPNTTNAIKILELYQFPETLIKDAYLLKNKMHD